MNKAVVFDLYETLITEWASDKYTSRKCAADLGIELGLFRDIWEACHKQMDIGAYTYRQVLMRICTVAGITPAPETLDLCESKRIASKNQCFAFPNGEVLKMLAALKAARTKLALCSNCSFDEVHDFDKSDLSKYFDAVVFSYEAGVAKPDEKIYRICADKLAILPSECLYVGDGGSHELYGAQSVGMKPLRAMWFLNQYAKKVDPMPFCMAGKPEMVFRYLTA